MLCKMLSHKSNRKSRNGLIRRLCRVVCDSNERARHLHLLHNSCCTGVNEGREEMCPGRFVEIDLFWMTLRSHHEGMVGNLHKFRHTVLAITADDDALSRSVDCLMMKAICSHNALAKDLFH